MIFSLKEFTLLKFFVCFIWGGAAFRPGHDCSVWRRHCAGAPGPCPRLRPHCRSRAGRQGHSGSVQTARDCLRAQTCHSGLSHTTPVYHATPKRELCKRISWDSAHSLHPHLCPSHLWGCSGSCPAVSAWPR